MTDPENKPEFPREVRNSQHGHHESGYTVEVRCVTKKPASVNGKLIGGEWTQIDFPRDRVGVPADRPYSFIPAMGLYSYPAAQALRWWWLAEAHARDICALIGIESRLVEHAIKLDYEARGVASVDEVGEVSFGRRRPTAQPDSQAK